MRILIVGSGAIGGVTALYLRQAGSDITLLCHREETAKQIRESGLILTGKRGEKQVKINALSTASELKGIFDAVLIVTKAYDMPAAAKSVLPYLSEDGVMVSVQNGMCLEEMTLIAGEQRSAACIVTFSSTMISDTHIDFTGEGGYILGRVTKEKDDIITKLACELSSAGKVIVADNIEEQIYSKFIINSGITCSGALTGQTLGQLLTKTCARKFFIAIVREAMALAGAMKIKVPPFGGKLDYYKFISGNNILDDLRRHIILLIMGAKYRKLTSSSLTALRRGKKTETAYLNGWISRKAKEYGVHTPVNDAIIKMIEEIEAGKRAISPQNLVEIMNNH